MDFIVTEHVVYNAAESNHLAIVTNVNTDKVGNLTYDVFVYDFNKIVSGVSCYDSSKHDNEKFFITSFT